MAIDMIQNWLFAQSGWISLNGMGKIKLALHVLKIYICTYINTTMDTKLTLKLDTSVIEQAKSYAKEKNTSLSKLIESYLSLLIDPKENPTVTPLVKSLSGVVKLPKNYEAKNDYRKHLLNKYAK